MPPLVVAMSEATQGQPDAKQEQLGVLQEPGIGSAESIAQASAANFHSYADLFPLMKGETFERLVADIKAQGQCVPIMRVDGLILDGRNRYLACLEAGIEPWFEDYTGTLNPLDLVVSLNRIRRHMTESQLAMAAAKLATMPHGGDRRSDQAAKLPLVSQADAARLLGVSERYVRSAKVVHQHGTMELVHRVECGDLSIPRALRIATSLNEPRATGTSRDGRASRDAVKEIVHVEPDAAPALMQRTTDEVVWSAQQAGALRAARDALSGLPIDLETVAQMLEATGRDCARRLASGIATVLKHLVKFDLATREHRGQRIWRRKTNRARCEIHRLLAGAPSLQPTVQALIDETLRDAKQAALVELRHGERRLVDPTELLYTKEQIMENWFPKSPSELPNLFCSAEACQCDRLCCQQSWVQYRVTKS